MYNTVQVYCTKCSRILFGTKWPTFLSRNATFLFDFLHVQQMDGVILCVNSEFLNHLVMRRLLLQRPSRHTIFEEEDVLVPPLRVRRQRQLARLQVVISRENFIYSCQQWRCAKSSTAGCRILVIVAENVYPGIRKWPNLAATTSSNSFGLTWDHKEGNRRAMSRRLSNHTGTAS